MAETSSLLNCRTGNRTAGSNPALTAFIISGYSEARLSRLLWEQEIAGSNPATPTFKRIKLLIYNLILFFVSSVLILIIER